MTMNIVSTLNCTNQQTSKNPFEVYRNGMIANCYVNSDDNSFNRMLSLKLKLLK